ncbi:ornithine carbamoyltransferase [Ramlibacter sp. G-1-2-2]|uniref:Ornithine carbamoyltransferase n=1 Tax=Ramlibacter agri TaxID=2728837 RepID=A0A848H198_9BURK|nr:ornithine carbamoyltransferase [Ramlibacter agri]NML43371.1 ornithine carbamoyltransferase [Ramlibacter agri]
MSLNLRNRSLLTVQDFTQREFRYLLDLARDLKRAKYARTEQKHLLDKEICLIFEKTSTRTRCAFEVACHDQGANVTYLDPAGSQIGHKESFKDTARVLGRMFDAIEYRGAAQGGVETLAKYAGVPVFNGLTDEYHPTQMLADVMTMREYSDKPVTQIKYAFLGDTRNNMGHSLMIVGCLMGMDVRICGPKELWPADEYVKIARELETLYGAKLTITDDPKEAVSGVDFIHTDVWVSMGEPKEVWKERIALLMKYQVNAALLKASGNPQVKFMHCLPAFHDTETKVGKQLAEEHGIPDGLEVTDEVFESEANVAFEQAENRLHTIKAIMVATLGD